MDLEKEIAATLNRASAENESNTPDYILAQYLMGCLAAFNTAVQQRENWYGRDPRPSAKVSPCNCTAVHPGPCESNRVTGQGTLG